MSQRRVVVSRRRSAAAWLRPSFSGEIAEPRRIVPAGAVAGELDYEVEERNGEKERWSRILPDLLAEIVNRVEAGAERWPLRKDVVACAGVCRRWREVTKGVVRSPLEGGKITFPSSLKQPGPRGFPMQCFIKRNKKDSTFFLYLGLTQTFTEKGKFLLAARRVRHSAHTEYIISFDADDLFQGSNAYMGKLRSDFLGTKFTIYNNCPPHNGANASTSRPSRRFASKKISPLEAPAGDFQVGKLSYKSNLLKSRGPRRIYCTLQCPFPEDASDDPIKSRRSKDPVGPVTLKNKAPRWHEHLQCWCLNFHGRVTVASVKNFQLVATSDPDQPWGVGDEETVLLQFGKVGVDVFTMDYRQPLSAFQAFAICLTSFGSKFACE